MNHKPSLTVVFLALAVLAAAPWAASAQTLICDDNTRAEFAATVDSGATDADLEARFGYCRTSDTEPTCTPTEVAKTGSELDAVFEEIKVVTNFNVSYERMNGCGYHPQAEMVACDIEIRRPTGYFPFPGGSFEHVRFCFDCDRNGTYEFTTLGFVHVTDNVAPLPTPSWFHLAYATTFGAPAICTTNNGGQGNVRAILSWFTPPAGCFSMPFWGNRIDFTMRRDP